MVAIARWLVATVALTLGCGDNIKLSSDGGTDAGTDAAVDGGQLDFPASPDDYQAGLVSYVSDIVLPEVVDQVPTCCYDFGAISENDGIDNAFVKFVDAIGGQASFDLQQIYDDALDAGQLVWLFDHRGLDIQRTDQFTLALLHGQFDGPTTIVEARAGEGSYKIQSRSFQPGTGTPRSYFDGASFNKPIPSISAGPREIEVPFAVAGGDVPIPLKRARITGTATPSIDGVVYVDGQLSGYILEDDFYEALNNTLSERCSCISGYLPVFAKVGDTWEADCPSGPTVATSCMADDEEICVTLAGRVQDDGLCSLWTLFSGTQLDIDSDGDEEPDAVSFGLLFNAVHAKVVDGIE